MNFSICFVFSNLFRNIRSLFVAAVFSLAISFNLQAQETVIAVWDFAENSVAGDIHPDFASAANPDLTYLQAGGSGNNAFVNEDETGGDLDNSFTMSTTSANANAWSNYILNNLHLGPTSGDPTAGSGLVDNKFHFSVSFKEITIEPASGDKVTFIIKDANQGNGTNWRITGLQIAENTSGDGGSLKASTMIINGGSQNGTLKYAGHFGQTQGYTLTDLTIGVTVDYSAEPNGSIRFWIDSPDTYSAGDGSAWGFKMYNSDGWANTNGFPAMTATPGAGAGLLNAVVQMMQFAPVFQDAGSKMVLDQIKISTGTYENTVEAGNTPTPTPNITFNVDPSTSLSLLENSIPHVVGNFGDNGSSGESWNPGLYPMTDDDGDGIWSLTLPLEDGNYTYKYTLGGWENQEFWNCEKECLSYDGAFWNRALTVAGADQDLASHHWNQCPGEDPAESITYTFEVNTASIDVGPNGMFAGGGVLGGAMAIPLSDEDGDGIWTGSFEAVPNNIGGAFIFLNSPNNPDDWGAIEQLAGQFCAFGQYNDRLLPCASEDTTVTACFGDCSGEACGFTDNGFDIIHDFEEEGMNMDIAPFGNIDQIGIVDNPDVSDINYSTRVLQMVKTESSEPWAGIAVDAEGTINFDQHYQLRIKSYSPEAGKVVKVKLETTEGDVEGYTHEVDVLTTVSNSWEILTYDFTGAPDLDYTTVVIFPDFGNQNPGTFYFDDIEVGQGEFQQDNGDETLFIYADPSDVWTGYMQVYQLDGTFAFGNTWSVPDLKTTIDTQTNEIILQPNFSAYDASDSNWVNEDGSGNAIMEGITQVESYTAFNERPIHFSVAVHEYTLDESYTCKAFVRALDPNNNFTDITNGAYSFEISEPGNFIIYADELPEGFLVQYGFTVVGPVANPDDEEALGRVVIMPETYVDPCPVNEDLIIGNINIIEVDDDNNDGFAEFDLNTILSSELNESYTISYHVSVQDAEENINFLISPYTNQQPEADTIYVRVQSPNDESCYEIVAINLLVNPYTPTLQEFISQNTFFRVEAETQGHFGVGGENESFPNYYMAMPFEKEGLGMYNDVYYFNPDGSLTIFTNGDIYGKAAPILEAFGSDQGLGQNQYLEYENYPSDNIESSWNLSSDNDGLEQISLSGNGYLGFFHGAGLTYDLIEINENSIILATYPSWDSPNRWFITLTSNNVDDVISINNPSEGEVFDYNTDSVEISYFTTYLETDFMQYSVNGADPVNTSTGPFNIDVESGQSYEVTVSLTDSNYDQLSTPLTDTVNFSVANAPSISITSPDDFAEYPINTTEATFTYSISDFVVAEDGTGDGYIQYIIGNSLDSSGEFAGDFSTIDVYSSSETLVDLSLVEPSTTDLGDEYIIRLQLVDNDGVYIGIFDQVTIVIQNINFTVIGSVEDGGSINSTPYGTYNSINSYLLDGFELGVDGAIVYEVTYYPGDFNDIFGIDQLSSYNLDENDLAITSEAVVVNSIDANGEELNYDLNELFDNPGAGLYKRHYQLVDNNNNPVSSILDQVTYSVMTLPSLSYEETATNGAIFPNSITEVTMTLNPVSLNMDSAAAGFNLIPGNGHIQYTVNGSDPVSVFENTEINLPVTAGQDYSVHAFLVDNLYQPVYPEVSVDYSFSVAGNSVVSDGIYWVDANVLADSSATGSQDNPFKIIQTAIDTASNLDTVMVNPGTYVENISLDDKYVTITTPDPSTSAASTIIDGGSNGISVIDINGLGLSYEPEQESSILISGFTITNGLTASYEVASAIWLHSTSNINIGINFENLIIENNLATNAAAVYLYYTNTNRKMQFNNVVFRDNNAVHTLAGFNQEFEMNACEFYNNEGNITIQFWHNGDTHYSTIKNTIVRDNLTSRDLNVTDAIIINSNIIGNSLNNRFDGNSAVVNTIIDGGQFFTNDGLLTVKNSHLKEGGTQIINQISNFLTYENNSEGEILFNDVSNNDYNLSNYSPAIGGGVNSVEIYSTTYPAPLVDFSGNSRPNPEGSNVDMGAFENPLAETIHNTNIYVSTSGTDEDTVGTEDNPFLTIQAAVNYAIEGDNILVSPGEYIEQISILNKGLNFISTEPQGASIALPATGNTLSFSSNIGIINSSITGFNIYPSQDTGGGTNGIWAYGEHYVTINDCVITDFNDRAIGTGISSVTVNNSLLVDNNIVLFQDNCTVGALGLQATFYNSTIINHQHIYMSCASNSAAFVNTIIMGTPSDSSGYTSPPEFNRVITDSPLVVPQSNSTWQLAPESFTDLYFTDYENRDFTLQNTSPAIGYGYYPISTDILGNSRPAPLGSNVDIGAYESELGVPNNARPRMDNINNLDINEDEGEQSFYITGVVDGDILEIQNLSFVVETNNSDLFESTDIQYDQGQSIATFSYNTTLNAYGTAEVSVTLSDDGGTENGAIDYISKTFSIDVAAVNDSPTAILLLDGNYSVDENTIDIIVDNLLSTDVDDDTFTYQLVTGEGDSDNANFTINGSELMVSSAFDFETQEQASIRVRTTDPGGLNHDEVIIIQINNLNDPSVVQDQVVNIDEDTMVAITLAGFDLENDQMQFFISSTPNTGTLYQTEDGESISSLISPGDLVINSQNIILYEPFENGYGENYAVFNYYINDGNQDSSSGEITINVNPVNDLPTSVSLSSNTIDENLLDVIGQLLTIDNDPGDSFTYEFVEGTGDSDNELFTIEGNSLINNTDFDFEDQNQYSVRIRSFNENDSIEQQFIINVLNVNDINIVSSSSDSYCEGELANGFIEISEINQTAGSFTFNWTGPNGFSSQDQSIENLNPGTYILDFADEYFTYNETFTIGQIPIYNDLEICYITSDEEDFTKNRIYFNSAGNYNVATFEVLRETSAVNEYESIGFVLPSEDSFLDNTSNNQQQQYKYKVRSVDACGINSDLSSEHYNTLLQANLAAGGSVNLSWSAYFGVEYSTFYIYRSINNADFELLNAIPSNQFTFNDTNADTDANDYRYYVAIIIDDCGDSGRSSVSTVTLKSNLLSIVDGSLSNQEVNFEGEINIYPNPTNDIINLSYPDYLQINKIELYNNLGQLIHRGNSSVNKISLEGSAQGVYFVKIYSSEGIINKRVIKN